MAKPIKVLRIGLSNDTGASASDGITSDGRISITPVSGADSIWYRTRLDGGDWSGWIQATGNLIASPGSDGAWAVEVQERSKKGATLYSASLAFTLDTSADKDAAATLDVGDALVNSAEMGAVGYTLDGLDGDATAQLTISDGTHISTRPLSVNASFTVDLTGFNDGLISSSIVLTDIAGNRKSVTGPTTTLDTSADTGTPAAFTVADALVNDAEKVAVSYTLAGLDADATAQLTLSDGSRTATHGLPADGTLAIDLGGFADGLVTSSLRVTDLAGNTKVVPGPSTTLDTSADTGTAATLMPEDILLNDAEKSAAVYTVAGLDSDASVLVTILDGTHSVTRTFTANGSLAFDLTGFDDGPVAASMAITDAAGNTKSAAGSAATLDTSADKDAPATLTPADTLIGDGERAAVGYVVAGLDSDATAIVTVSDGVQSATHLFAADGGYAFDLGGFADGPITASMATTDVAGNTRWAAAAPITLDTQVASPIVALVDDTGRSHADRITYNGALSVTGIEPGATTEFSIDEGASWRAAFAAAEGNNVVIVRQTDAAGNVSAPAALDFTFDTTPPTANDDQAATVQGGPPLTIDVLANDDLEGVPPTAADITKFDPAGHGSVALEPNGSFVYTPHAGFVGADSFAYTIADAAGNTAVGTVYVNVGATDPGSNLPPTVTAPLLGWAPPGGDPISVWALENAWDFDNDPLSVVGLPNQLPAGVTFDVDTATFTFDPALSSGATVNYGVSDGFATAPTSVTFVASVSPFVAYDPQSAQLGSLIGALVPAASGIEVDPESIALTAGTSSVNFYDPGAQVPLGIGRGLLITSGTTPPPVNTRTWFGQDNAMPGDSALDAVVNTVFHTQPFSYDATLLSFSFSVNDATSTSISFDLVFGSDEYPEWVDQYVDCAVVLVNDVNVALFGHDALHPLSVITPNLQAGYFVDNAPGQLPIEYDGVSHPLKIVAPVHAGTNTIKIAVGDTGDHIYDSGLFLANLVAGDAPGSGVVIPVPVPPGNGSGSSVTGSAQDEYFEMTDGNDTVSAGAGDDIVLGKAGNDQIYGEDGEDALSGGDGKDTLDGGAGEDELVGGTGKDMFTGGPGWDAFKFKSGADWASGGVIDQIADFGDGGNGNTLVLYQVSDLHGDTAGADGDVLLFAASRLTGMAGYVPDPDWTMPSGETFSTVPDGGLSNSGAPTAAHAQFVYDPASGVLTFDPDGTGSASAQEVVMIGIASHPALLISTALVIYG